MSSAGDGRETERVSKILAARGLCSRREAERLIDAGCVRVDGVVVAEQGARAARDADVEITPEGRALLERSISVAVHKPVGVVSAMPDPGQRDARSLLTAAAAHGMIDRHTVAATLAAAGDLAVAGRLDRASRGLLILTTDGVAARALIGGHGIVKRYLVTVDADVASGQIERLNRAMRIDGRLLLPMKVESAGRRQMRFELVEGMKHQIRRCCGKVGLEVTDLLRDSVGPIQLGDLPEGKWRPLQAGELEAVRASIISSPR